MGIWTVQSAFWVAQALRASGTQRMEKWNKARLSAPWLSEMPCDGPAAENMLLEALAFMVKAVDEKIIEKQTQKTFVSKREPAREKKNFIKSKTARK